MTARTLSSVGIASSPKISSRNVTITRKPVAATSMNRRMVTRSKRSWNLSKLLPSVAALSLVGVMAVAGVTVFHLVSINASVAKGFELKKLHKSMATLTEQNKRLVVQQAEAGSINKVQEVAQRQGLVQTKNEEYLNALHFTQR